MLTLVSLGATAAAVVVSASSAAPGSIPLHGKLRDISNFFAPACGSSTGVCSSFTATGSIAGNGVVSVEALPNAEGISKARTVIHTKKGDLRCNEAALFDLVGSDHAFVDLCLVTGGTGLYEGATGYIQEVGTFDFAANLGEIEYFGKLTLAG